MGVRDRINLRTLIMLTHNRTLRPVSLSRKGVWFCFIFFPFLSFFFFLLGFSSFIVGLGVALFFFFFQIGGWKKEGERGLIVREG